MPTCDTRRSHGAPPVSVIGAPLVLWAEGDPSLTCQRLTPHGDGSEIELRARGPTFEGDTRVTAPSRRSFGRSGDPAIFRPWCASGTDAANGSRASPATASTQGSRSARSCGGDRATTRCGSGSCPSPRKGPSPCRSRGGQRASRRPPCSGQEAQCALIRQTWSSLRCHPPRCLAVPDEGTRASAGYPARFRRATSTREALGASIAAIPVTSPTPRRTLSGAHPANAP